MRYKPLDVLRLVASPLGRHQLSVHMYSIAWPVFRIAGRVYRRTLGRRLRLIAVVGSYGKTTTRAALITALGTRSLRVRGKARSQVALSMLRMPPGLIHGVLELGVNRRGQMARHAVTVQPDVVVFTSIGSEHGRSLGSLDDILEEKANILWGLRRGGLLVLNGDDPRVRSLATRVDAKLLTFGIGEHNHVRASDIHLDWPRGTRFLLHLSGRTHNARVPLLGRKVMYSVLAAIAVAIAEGLTLEEVLRRLERLEPMPGRLQPIRLENRAYLLRDEYKSSLETIDAALDVLEEIPARRIVVLGDISEPPGSQGPIYRRLGERLAGIASRVIIVGEHFKGYASGARRAGFPRSELVNAGKNFRAAVEAVREDLRPDDVVLIKGRNTQRLERIAFALQDRTVGCALTLCRAANIRCEHCPMLVSGWSDPRRATIVGASTA